MFTSQLTWEGKSLTSVGAARVHPSSRVKVFFVGYQIAGGEWETLPKELIGTPVYTAEKRSFMIL